MGVTNLPEDEGMLFDFGEEGNHEMWMYNSNALHNTDYYVFIEMDENIRRYKGLAKSYLPFTRQKKNARKYKKLKQAEWIKSLIDNKGDFKCEIKEIKITYTEEEI
jgi:uncharacterized membrane protein (UPF0127 family)